jgi:ubiquinone/menaquinone biosynthesis C-methylase UbiE
MPDQTKFWDRIAKRYAQSPVPDESIYQEKLERTRALFQSGSRVLEFGCGTGSTAIAHAQHVEHIDALDISQNMLDIAREKANRSGCNNVSFYLSFLREFDHAKRDYDVVLGMSILHLIPDLEQELQEVYSRIRPGGYFVSSSSCIAELAWFFRVLMPLLSTLGVIPKLNVFNPEALKQYIENAGFIIDDYWQPAKGKAVFIIARKPK